MSCSDIIDPRSGAVQVEFGPAMMWNTTYGMQPVSAGTASVRAEQAHAIADRWLQANRPGENAGDADTFPVYYTVHTLRGDRSPGCCRSTPPPARFGTTPGTAGSSRWTNTTPTPQAKRHEPYGAIHP